MSAAAVRFVEVLRHYGDVRAVDGVSLEIADGEFFSMLGPSGSGKTTCLRMLAGFERPTAGRVELHGRDVTDLPPYERDVNTVFQDYALFPHLTVAENVAYGLTIKKVARPEIRRRVDEALDLVRLPGYGARKPGQLSGGQRQRVALARAQINRPRVLVLDEPLGALDLKLRQQMQTELKGIQRQVGITFLFVTHDQEEALAMSDRLAVFNQGRIEQVGTPAEVYERPRTVFVAGFVGTTNLLLGALAERLTGTAGPAAIRPERIRMLAPDAVPGADEAGAAGLIREAVYLGMHTRYSVELDGGGELGVVAQNLDLDAADAASAHGRRVQLAWERSAVRPLVG